VQRVEAVVGNWKEEGEVARRCKGGDAQPTEEVRPHRRATAARRRGGGKDYQPGSGDTAGHPEKESALGKRPARCPHAERSGRRWPAISTDEESRLLAECAASRSRSLYPAVAADARDGDAVFGDPLSPLETD
jgi:hypothetical protein